MSIIALAALTAALAVVQWSASPRPATSSSLPPVEVPLGIEVPPLAEEPAAEALAADGESVDQPAPEFVRVGNTGGQGIALRLEPGSNSARLVARAENSILQIVGSDVEADGRTWRLVQDVQGNRGWAPADFLTPTTPPS